MKKPLVIVSGLRPREAQFVRSYVERWKRPCLLEATSRLRGDPSLDAWEVRGGEKSLARLEYDGVIRIGNVPTLRLWRDLEKSKMPVVCFSSVPLSGLPRVEDVKPLMALADVGVAADLGGQFEPWSVAERDADRLLFKEKERLFAEYPLSEPSWMRWLSQQIPRDARLFLGNSLPIREWDFSAHATAATDVFANRGTNGIDGLVSTFAGVADAEKSNWAIVGDLSALYDGCGLWALRQRPVQDFNLVILNNGGGQIFHRMFRNPLFLNEHNLEFQHWAKMWGLKYQRLENDGHLPSLGEPRVVEIVPFNEQSEKFWTDWERL